MVKNKKKLSFEEFVEKRRSFKEKIARASKKRKKELLRDSDRDGLSDYEEKNIYGTNPKDPDTDKDGMRDGDEVRLGRNPRGQGSLKDLFIPHAGNNYQPRALSSKRLIFHTIGAAAVKLIVVSLLFSFPASAWMTPDAIRENDVKIIELTNQERGKLDLEKLKENNQLDQAAYGKAQDMLIGQYFAHQSAEGWELDHWVKGAGYDFSLAGENLAMGFTTAEKTVQAWVASPTHYANIKERNFQDIGVATVNGPYAGLNTNLTVQYFGRLKIAPTAPIAAAPTKNILLAQKTEIMIANTPEKETKVLAVRAELPADTKKATVQVKEREIALEKTASTTWQAAAIIYEKEEGEIKNPIIPASITVEDNSGATAVGEISWKDIKPKEITKTDQYQVYKDNPSGLMALVSTIGSWYLRAILVLAAIALLLGILVEVKRQHPHLIIRSVAFIGLITCFLIF